MAVQTAHTRGGDGGTGLNLVVAGFFFLCSAPVLLHLMISATSCAVVVASVKERCFSRLLLLCVVHFIIAHFSDKLNQSQRLSHQ